MALETHITALAALEQLDVALCQAHSSARQSLASSLSTLTAMKVLSLEGFPSNSWEAVISLATVLPRQSRHWCSTKCLQNNEVRGKKMQHYAQKHVER